MTGTVRLCRISVQISERRWITQLLLPRAFADIQKKVIEAAVGSRRCCIHRASRRAIVVEAARKEITTDRWLSACLSAKPRLLVSLTIPDGLGAQTFPHRPLRVFLAYSAWWWLLSDRSGGSACILYPALPCQPFCVRHGSCESYPRVVWCASWKRHPRFRRFLR